MELLLIYVLPTLFVFSISIVLWHLGRRMDDIEWKIIPETKRSFDYRGDLHKARMDLLTQEIEEIKKRISSHH
jgi:hypothetical protein